MLRNFEDDGFLLKKNYSYAIIEFRGEDYEVFKH